MEKKPTTKVRKKAWQTSNYIGVPVTVPQVRGTKRSRTEELPERSTAAMMRPQVQRQGVLSAKDKLQKMRTAFIDEMDLNIKNSIKNILNKASKLEEKKAALLNVTRLTKGICSEAERKAAVKPGDVLKFVSSTEEKYRPVDFVQTLCCSKLLMLS